MPDTKSHLLLCELKTLTGGTTSTPVQLCLTKSGAETLAKRRTQGLGDLFEGHIFVPDAHGRPMDTGMTVSSLMRDLGIVGVNHQILSMEASDPGMIEQVTPKLVVMNS